MERHLRHSMGGSSHLAVMRTSYVEFWQLKVCSAAKHAYFSGIFTDFALLVRYYGTESIFTEASSSKNPYFLQLSVSTIYWKSCQLA